MTTSKPQAQTEPEHIELIKQTMDKAQIERFQVEFNRVIAQERKLDDQLQYYRVLRYLEFVCKEMNLHTAQAVQKEREQDWEMLLSKIELEVQGIYTMESLDSSDQSKWGDEYKKLNKISTQKSNEAVKVATMAFRAKLLQALTEKSEGEGEHDR